MDPNATLSNAKIPTKPQFLKHTSTKSGDDNELSIFDAERYFSEANDSVEATTKLDVTARPKASSVSSEASWNSESVLLSHQPSSHADKIKGFPSKKPHKSLTTVLRRLFWRNCPCSGEKSVDVEEKSSDTKIPIQSNSMIDNNSSKTFSATQRQNSKTISDNGLSSIPEKITAMEFGKEVNTVTITAGKWAKDQSFWPAFGNGHIFKNSGRISFTAPHLQFCKNVDEPPRDSLEVFQLTEAVKKPAEVQRRASVLPLVGESYGKSTVSFLASPKTRQEDDAASDASSDLFEIESLSTSQAMSRRCDSLDAAGIHRLRRSLEVAPSECYAPSEVSAEWSVNTAEGFDRSSMVNFSSVGTKFEEFQFDRAEAGRFKAMVGGDCRRKGNEVLTYRCEKSSISCPIDLRRGLSMENSSVVK